MQCVPKRLNFSVSDFFLSRFASDSKIFGFSGAFEDEEDDDELELLDVLFFELSEFDEEQALSENIAKVAMVIRLIFFIKSPINLFKQIPK